MKNRLISISFVFLAVFSPYVLATKPTPIVVGRWIGMPANSRQGATIDLILRVGASSSADPVIVEILPSEGYELIKGKRMWRGTLKLGQSVDLPITIRCTKPGEWRIGARIANGSGADVQVSGALVGLIISH